MGCFQTHSKEVSYKVHLLDDTEVVLLTSPSRRGRDLLDQVFSHLNLVEIEYFGLRYHDADEGLTLWLDEEKPLYKQLKSSSSSSSSSINLFFCVRFYVSDPAKLSEEVTRYQFYLQLRRDVAQGRITVSRELAAQLGSYILQVLSEVCVFIAFSDIFPPNFDHMNPYFTINFADINFHFRVNSNWIFPGGIR